VTWDIKGRIVLITGGNSGIGLATATALAQQGAAVVMTARDMDRGRVAAGRVKADTGVSVVPMILDLAVLDSVRSFTDTLTARFGRIDVLVNNAGCYVTPRRETVDGFEWTMGVNHLGPFLLTCRLARDPATRPRRIINVASDMHRSARRDLRFTRLEPQGRYRGTEAYARSKLANIIFTKELARRLDGTGTVALSVHPGTVATRIAQDGDSRIGALIWKVAAPGMKTPKQGAATVVYAATAADVEGYSGAYLANEQLSEPDRAALDVDLDRSGHRASRPRRLRPTSSWTPPSSLDGASGLPSPRRRWLRAPP
jgi:NAD(P)-dependent dehydrogenase (short-subunit alcohol dehydrogenase family)